jgi:group II intron reverse transcriptase/maturase
VKQQLIPKGNGGMRQLGIPTVLDRFIQQALLQVLQPIFDPGFSSHSHGFRPGKRAHDAIVEAQRYIQQGRKWVVDVDLAAFFDRVNHDILMGKLAKRIEDRRVLGLIRRYLNAGILANGVTTERHEGTPQGGPFTPPTQVQTLNGGAGCRGTRCGHGHPIIAANHGNNGGWSVRSCRFVGPSEGLAQGRVPDATIIAHSGRV